MNKIMVKFLKDICCDNKILFENNEQYECIGSNDNNYFIKEYGVNDYTKFPRNCEGKIFEFTKQNENQHEGKYFNKMSQEDLSREEIYEIIKWRKPSRIFDDSDYLLTLTNKTEGNHVWNNYGRY